MSKYINQKQLLMSLSDWQFGSQDDEQLWETIEKVINSIESLPTIDIVHCEDCKHFNADDYECENSEVAFDMSGGGDCSASRCRTDFCSFGERIE